MREEKEIIDIFEIIRRLGKACRLSPYSMNLNTHKSELLPRPMLPFRSTSEKMPGNLAIATRWRFTKAWDFYGAI